MAKGKMNWGRIEKENRAIKQGVLICDDDGLIQEDIIADDSGVKQEPAVLCPNPNCSALIHPSLLQEHLKKCRFKNDKNPFDLKFTPVKGKGVRTFNNTIEEIEILVETKYGEARLRGLLADLTQRKKVSWKPLSGKALNKYLMLTYPIFSAEFDGENFVILGSEDRHEKFKASLLAEVLKWLKATWKPIKKINNPIYSIAPRKFPKFKTYLSDYQGETAYDGMVLTIASNPEGTYSLKLRSTISKYEITICSSARMESAIVMAEYCSTLKSKPKIEEEVVISEILKFNSRVVNGKEIRVVVSANGLVDIYLYADGCSETVCKNTLPIAALNFLEFLSTGQIFRT